MKRKVFSILLAVLFVLQGAAIVAFADTVPPTEVSVPINVEVTTASSQDWGSEASVMSAGEFDFRAVMDTTGVKAAVKAWYDYSLERVAYWANGDAELEATLMDRLNASTVTGEFAVTVTYPSVFAVDSAYTADSKAMYGFNDAAKVIFHEVSRNVSVDGATTTLTVNIATNAPNNTESALVGMDLYANADTYLDGLELTVSGVAVDTIGDYTVTGAFTGSTVFALGKSDNKHTVAYFGAPAGNLSADVKVTELKVLSTDVEILKGNAYEKDGYTLVKIVSTAIDHTINKITVGEQEFYYSPDKDAYYGIASPSDVNGVTVTKGSVAAAAVVSETKSGIMWFGKANNPSKVRDSVTAFDVAAAKKIVLGTSTLGIDSYIASDVHSTEPDARVTAFDVADLKKSALNDDVLPVVASGVVANVAPTYGAEPVRRSVALVVNDRTMLPARFVAESLGATVDWNDATKTVTIVKGDTSIILVIGSNIAIVNGNEVLLDAPALVQDGKTYTPVRFIAEALGATVEWDASTQSVTIIPAA